MAENEDTPIVLCRTCPAFHMMQSNELGSVGECRKDPPEVQMIPVQSLAAQGGIEMKAAAVVRQVSGEFWCSHHPAFEWGDEIPGA